MATSVISSPRTPASTNSNWLVLYFYLRALANPSQLADVCKGLQYLHEQDIVHSDLKGVRVSPFFSCRGRVESVCFRITCLLVTTTGPSCLISAWRVSTALVGTTSRPTRVTQEGPLLTWPQSSFTVHTRKVNIGYP